MRILHVLDHSLPQYSGYAFRTAAILREQRELGWETVQLTAPRRSESRGAIEEAEGWRFHRAPLDRKRAVKAGGVLDRCADWPRFRERASRFVESDRTWTQSVVRYKVVYEPLVPAERMTVPA